MLHSMHARNIRLKIHVTMRIYQMYFYIHTYIHTYVVRACMHTYIHAYTHMYTHIHTHIHTYMHTYMHTYIHTHIRTWCVHAYIHTYVRICSCTIRYKILKVTPTTEKHVQLLRTMEAQGHVSIGVTRITQSEQNGSPIATDYQ